MNTEELMLFYANMENREWELVTNGKAPDEINSEDFAHAEFCAAVKRHMIMQYLIKNLTDDYSANRYWAGLRLYEYWSIEKMFPNRNRN